MSIFADNLRARIEMLGLSQAELARRLGYDPRRLGHYITGLREPDLATVVQIARVLDASVDQLLGLEEAEDKTKRSKLVSQINSACSGLSEPQLETVLLLASTIAREEHGKAGRNAKPAKGKPHPKRG